jgi:hypothetical protein
MKHEFGRCKRRQAVGAAALALSCGLIGALCAQPAISQAAPAPGEASSASQSSQTESELQARVKQILAAYGGEAKLREMETVAFRGKGKINEFSSISKAANSFDCTMVSMGDKLRIEMNVMGQPLITGYDGKVAWVQQGDQVFPCDPANLERIQGEIKHSLEHELLALVEPKVKLTAKPDLTVDGRQCQGMDVQLGTDTFTLYTDKETHLVSRAEFQGFDAEQGINAKVANEYLDYRPLFGSAEPFRIVEYTNGQKTTEAVQESEELDKTIGDAYFEMPAVHALARLQQGPVEIPFDYAYNQIMIKARANDDKDLVFIVDTGASQSMLDNKVAQTIGPLEKTEAYKVTTGGGTMNMNYMILKKLELGDLPLDNISVGCTDGSAFTQMHGSRPSGLLGANILKRFLVTIDFEQRKIIFADPDNVKIPAGAAVIPTKPAMGSLGVIIDGLIDNKLSIPFLVDTGAAFDNLSSTLVQPLVHEKLLPVSKILGLDGQQVDVGAIQFRTLKLGDFVADKPVFSIASTPAGSIDAGIITSKTIGILGNPLWSRYKLTIDYRHNRIFLEKSKEEAAINAITEQLDKIKMQLHADKDYKKAHAAYDKLLLSQSGDQNLASQALILAERGAASVDEAEAKHEKDLLLAAKNDFDSANDLARQCKNSTVAARVFAKLARHMADVDPSLLPMTRALISRSVALAPMDAEVLTSAALVMKAGNLSLSQKVADQALSADPANWDALWLRYQLCDLLNEPQDKPLVEEQLRRYYPNAPEVVALSHHAEIGKQPGPAKKPPQAAEAPKNGNKKRKL